MRILDKAEFGKGTKLHVGGGTPNRKKRILEVGTPHIVY